METLLLTKYRGAIALVGDHIDNLVREALQLETATNFNFPTYDLSLSYHITLFTKWELRSAPPSKVAELLDKADTGHIHCAGIGGNQHAGVFYIAVIWAAGQQLRKQLGLPPKDFHITLSRTDNHDIDKGIDTLFPGQFPYAPSSEFFDHLAFTLQSFGKYSEAQTYSTELILLSPHSHRGFLRLADAALSNGLYKLAMLAYGSAHQLTDEAKVQSYCLKKLISCSAHTEWGAVFQEEEIAQIPADLAPLLISPWSPALCQALVEAVPTPTLQLEPRDALFVPKRLTGSKFDKSMLYKLPRFFRWLIPFRFAIMSTPRHEDDIQALASSTLGIKRVLTLTEETPLKQDWFRDKAIANTFLPIPNFHPPSIEQMDLVMQLFLHEDNLPLLVHCGGGKGRAGTVAACYMAACGFKNPSYDQTQPELPASDAVALLRSLRPGSIETSQQEAFVSKWCSAIWKRQSIFPEIPPEPLPCAMVTEGTLSEDNDLFMLVGLPGAGKSWVSRSLLARDPSHWTYISQDESGSRSLCETAIGRATGRVLFDRCNVSASDRKEWLSLASNWCTSPVCVWFDYDRELCQSRAQLRAGHPTLPPGPRVANAVDQMARMFQPPTLEEGFKAIVTIRSFAAAQELIAWLSPPVSISKFPRTPHLIDLGAATDDDICTDTTTLGAMRGQVTITEKIDGANMGFSLSSDRKEIVVQNRSHYVNASSHEQFKKLGLWIERHQDELIKLLDKDPYFPERYILFGEWMYATHSIPYTHLPDYFIAYDFFDRSTNTWMGTKMFRNMLEPTSICMVPVIQEGTADVPSDADLKAMVQRPSAFYNGRVEGIYVKVERGSSVVYRAKVVRSDFIAGNEHWTRGGVRVNGLAIEMI